MFSSSSLFVLSFVVSSVFAHGQVTRITIDGKNHDAWTVNAPPKDSSIRHVNNYEPMLGVDNPGLNCGPGVNGPAPLVAQAMPGSEVRVKWNGADGAANWPHNTGPMLTYMASCEGECSKFDSTKAQWFKVHEAGRKDGNGEWMQQDIMRGQDAVVPLPKNIKPGQYLFRHEIIALHVAPGAGSAEFYVSCAQINVGGQGTGAPKPNELVKLPGAYKDSEPGISAENVFVSTSYSMPGPKIASFVNGDENNDDADNEDANNDDKQPAPGSQQPEHGSGQCHLYAAKTKKRSMYRPRAISRVMRGLDLSIH